MKRINLAEKFQLFSDAWSPRIVAELNDSHVKLAKFEGEFVWHKHDVDELFFVVKGEMTVKFRDCEEHLREGELLVVPAGVEHMPVAEEEAHVLLIEPKGTVNTGEVACAKTVERPEWI